MCEKLTIGQAKQHFVERAIESAWVQHFNHVVSADWCVFPVNTIASRNSGGTVVDDSFCEVATLEESSILDLKH
jgi:hypothetical protein